MVNEINSDAAYTGWIQDKERWKLLCLDVLGVVYGEDSKQWKELDDSDRIVMVAVGTPWHVEAQRTLERHASSLNILQSLGERLAFADEPPIPAAGPEPKGEPVPAGGFVVYGHNEMIREQVARLIEQEGRKAVILHEQANKGQTLIEKCERHAAEAGWAVVGAERGGDGLGQRGADREPVAGLVVDDAQVEGVEQRPQGRLVGVA